MSYLTLKGSVGVQGKNQSSDVKIIQALMNVYLRREKHTAVSVDGKMNQRLQTIIKEFQKVVLEEKKASGLIKPDDKTYQALRKILKDSFTTKAITAPSKGSLAWNSEGNEGGIYHSRRLHVPSATSGLTIGRGYDMKTKKSAGIIKDLNNAGFSPNYTSLLAKAVGLKGEKAKQFIIDNDLLDFEISPEQQQLLFKVVYGKIEARAKSACTNTVAEAKYGKCDWDNLHSKIQEMVIDLTYRGDYDKYSRLFLQDSIVNNDFPTFSRLIGNRDNWSKAGKDIPKDRQEKRMDFLAN